MEDVYVKVLQGDEPKDITFIYPYYENMPFFHTQLADWCRYPAELRKHLSVIIVDDGSPTWPATIPPEAHKHINIRLFRIGVDVRWNWLAARNIGAHHAKDGWMMITDMDHVVESGVLRSLIYGIHDKRFIYRFSRKGDKTHPHPNSWFMTKSMYWKVGGYDEAASGHYGTDGDYRRRCAATAEVRIMEDALVLHEYENNSSTVTYLRKQPEDARGKQILKQRRGLPPKVLTFPYQEIRA